MKKINKIANSSFLIFAIEVRSNKKTRLLQKALAMGAPYAKNIAMARANIPIFKK